MMENHFTESREATFFLALSLLVHFRESLHGINRESLLSEKLFGRAPVGFSRESTLGALPNGALHRIRFCSKTCNHKRPMKLLVRIHCNY
jgi:hypothetical protein